MKQNMNIGTRIAGTNDQGTSCGTIRKYCYGDNEANCTTGGGLYQWDQAMCGSTVAGAQGICPAGWHLPTHDEWTTLERAVCTSLNSSSLSSLRSCETDFPYDITTIGWRGTDEGATLQDSDGFAGLLAGHRREDGAFVMMGNGYWWTSTVQVGQQDTYFWYRNLYSGERIQRNFNYDFQGFSIRCVKD
jgi:uncharacterized protein (TIGR02145 family)